MSLESRVKKLEAEVLTLKKRASRFKRPQGPEEIAMRLAALEGGDLVDAERIYYKYDAVDWKRGGSRLQNIDALLLYEISWAKERPQEGAQKTQSVEELYG